MSIQELLADIADRNPGIAATRMRWIAGMEARGEATLSHDDKQGLLLLRIKPGSWQSQEERQPTLISVATGEYAVFAPIRRQVTKSTSSWDRQKPKQTKNLAQGSLF